MTMTSSWSEMAKKFQTALTAGISSLLIAPPEVSLSIF